MADSPLATSGASWGIMSGGRSAQGTKWASPGWPFRNDIRKRKENGKLSKEGLTPSRDKVDCRGSRTMVSRIWTEKEIFTKERSGRERGVSTSLPNDKGDNLKEEGVPYSLF